MNACRPEEECVILMEIDGIEIVDYAVSYNYAKESMPFGYEI
jgi:hypothetical protein